VQDLGANWRPRVAGERGRRRLSRRRLIPSPIPPARPMPAAGDGNESWSDVDVDVVHAGVGHDAAGAVVGNQPLENRGLARAGLEVDRVAAGVARGMAGARDDGARSARGNDLNRAEITLDAAEKGTGCGRETGTGRLK
jgi:hypothetical protein